jgi:DNA-binding MarR family transcriptional regulator
MQRDTLFTKIEQDISLIGKEMHVEQAQISTRSPAQNHVLKVIGIEGKMTVKLLAEKLWVTSGAVTQHIDGLEKAGLIKRQVSSTDRREVDIELTSEGTAAFDEVVNAQLSIFRKLFGELSDSELQTFMNLIEKVSFKYKNKGDDSGED